MTKLRRHLNLLLVLVCLFSPVTSFAIDVGGENDSPIANNDTATTNEDTPVTIDVLANDTDPDGDPLTISAVASPSNGTASVFGGTVTYTPDPNFFGPDSFIYSIEDGNGGTDLATVIITVYPVNDPPYAGDDIATTDENTPVTIDVLANDSDPDGDPLTIGIINTSYFGTVNCDSSICLYTPNPNFSGDDSFIYQAADGNGGSDLATVIITVNPVNDPPDCTAASPSHMLLWPPSGDFVDIQVLGVTDPDGDLVTVMITGIFQDEPVIGKGSGQTTPDGMSSSNDMTAIRAERDGKGDGRVYHIFFSAADSNGAECEGEVMVSVPHDQSGAPAVDGGAIHDSTGAL